MNQDDEGDATPTGEQQATKSNPGCDAGDPPENNAKKYEQPATQEQVLSPGTDYGAIIETSCGTIEVDLLEEQAPSTVANFIFLAEDGFYDGLTWHRVINEFVIQGGDPEGDGSGGPGYEFADELPAESKVYTFGAMAMANSGPDTQGSQFFIVTHDAENALAGKKKLEPAGLQPLYSYFGQASKKSFETLNTIQKVETSTDPATQDRPVNPVYILSVAIEER
ncbi:MAG TPA: peptidylprolyl isomerase [Actinomycetota bacterium]|nr:peptidylprolyl isomerase [Actinomycetota bacterium]